MPNYPYRDELTGYTIDVFRSLSDYSKPPEDGELPEEERGRERKWIREISATGKSTTFNRKGYW